MTDKDNDVVLVTNVAGERVALFERGDAARATKYPCPDCGAPVTRPGVYRLCVTCRQALRPIRTVAVNRRESDTCEAGTVGCCIDHDDSSVSQGCEPW